MLAIDDYSSQMAVPVVNFQYILKIGNQKLQKSQLIVYHLAPFMTQDLNGLNRRK